VGLWHLKKSRLQEAHVFLNLLAVSSQYLIKNAIFLIFPFYIRVWIF
jgi:hypothetical protein